MEFYNLNQKYEEMPIFIDESGYSFYKSDYENINEKIKKNIDERNLVFLFCENSTSSISSYISMLNNKIIPVMISYSLSKELLKNLLEIYKPNYIAIKTEEASNYNDYSKVFEVGTYDFLKANHTIEHNMSEDLALLLTTSGSTGSPKLVRQSYNNIDSNAKAIVEYLKLNENERPITSLPFNYTYGISVINSHLCVGSTILLTDKSVVQREFWEFLKKQKATSIAGVPYTYEMLNKMKFFKMDLPSLKTMTQAGGKISLELHKKFANYAHDNEKKFIVMYGQTEATARMSYLPHDKSLKKIGSMGIPIPKGKFELLGADGKVINSPNTIGELVYYGENVTLGYSEKIEDLSKGDERNGKLNTGDMAKVDEDGYYYIVGRKKRFLKIYGNRINLDEIERILKSKFSGAEFALSGKDDLLEIYYTSNIDLVLVSKFITDTFKINRNAFCLNKIDEIPKNEAGKTLYSNLGSK